MPEELSRNQSILRFDVILQHDWPIEQCLLHMRVFFGGKTKSLCFDLFIHWLIKQITNTDRNHFSRSYENRSIVPKAFRTFHDQCGIHVRVFATFTGTFRVKGGGRFRATTFFFLTIVFSVVVALLGAFGFNAILRSHFLLLLLIFNIR